MATIELEVIDNDPINCDYYGLLYESRIVRLVSQTSNLNDEMKQFVSNFLETVAYSTTKGQAAIDAKFKYITSLDNQITNVKKNLTNASKNVATARRAVSNYHGDVSNIKDPNVHKLAAKLSKLKDKYHTAYRKYDELLTAYINSKHIETNMEQAINYLFANNCVKSINDIKPQDVINTAFGATAFYDQLIHNGWKQVPRNSAVINHITQETFENSAIAQDPDDDFQIALSII